MSAQTHKDEFDENSVFNRLLSTSKSNSQNTPSSRLERIFAEAPNPAIDVKDFLPVYAVSSSIKSIQ